MSNPFRCILIEDERPAVEILESYLNNYEEFEFKASFPNVFYAQDYLKDHQVDIIFLDINMPALNGLDFLKSLKDAPLIIITSAYDEYAVEAFDLEVFDYLLKPYSLSRFNRTINRVKQYFLPLESTSVQRQTIVIKSGTRKVKLEVNEIMYIESQREYLLFFFRGKEPVKSRMTIKEAMEILPTEGFIQIHRSFIVNLNKVYTISVNEVFLDNKTLPISRMYKDGVNNAWESL